MVAIFNGVDCNSQSVKMNQLKCNNTFGDSWESLLTDGQTTPHTDKSKHYHSAFAFSYGW